MALTSLSLFYININLAFNVLYLNVIFYLITSSFEATKSKLNKSRNLYSKFYIKSKCAYPSRCMKKTAKKLKLIKWFLDESTYVVLLNSY